MAMLDVLPSGKSVVAAVRAELGKSSEQAVERVGARPGPWFTKPAPTRGAAGRGTAEQADEADEARASSACHL